MGWLKNTAHMEGPSNRLLFKDGISVSGLTLKYLFSYLSPQTYFSLFDQANSDLYDLITTTQAAQVLFSTDIRRPAKQRSEKQRKARLLSCVKKSLVRTSPREVIRDA